MAHLALDELVMASASKYGGFVLDQLRPTLDLSLGSVRTMMAGGKVDCTFQCWDMDNANSFRDDWIAVPRFGEHADHETRHEHGESQFVDRMRLGRNVPQAFCVFRCRAD